MMLYGEDVCDETRIRNRKFGSKAAVVGRGSEKREGGE